MGKIYTGKGDSGETTDLSGERLSKASLAVEAVGTLDELNSFLGVIRADSSYKDISDKVLELQESLFFLGAKISRGSVNDDGVKSFPDFNEKALELEKQIDSYQEDLPQLGGFVIPGDSALEARFHVARTVCRRAERGVAKLPGLASEKVFLNRLSDYLFVLAREVGKRARKDGETERVWRK